MFGVKIAGTFKPVNSYICPLVRYSKTLETYWFIRQATRDAAVR